MCRYRIVRLNCDRKNRMMWVIALILALASATQMTHAFLIPDESNRLVYPELLESRGVSGEKVLRINGNLTLNLEKASVFSEKLLIRSFEDGSLVTDTVNGAVEEQHLYHDTQNMASVLVKDNDGIHVEGLIGHSVRIKPLPGKERSAEGHVAHMLYEVKQRRPLRDDIGHLNDDALRNEFEVTDASSSDPGVEERSYDTIYPEVHMVLDVSFCQAFRYDKKAITEYISVFVIAANLRFRSVTYPNVKLIVVGITLEREGHDSYMVHYKGHPKQVLFDKTLNNFMMKYRADPMFSKADYYFLLTGLDLVGLTPEGEVNAHFSGYAFGAGACTDFKVGTSEDEPLSYDGVHLFSHETAHLLGCMHDEDPPYAVIPGHPGSQNCPWDDGFIMSYVINYKNHYTFSHCCVESIRFVEKYVYSLCGPFWSVNWFHNCKLRTSC